MSTKGLIGFRHNNADKLIYNHSDSHPDTLGLRVLRELRGVKNWNVVLDRIESLLPIPEQRQMGEHTSMAESEIRRAFPDLEYKGVPQNFYDLYQPLQGTLQPYLDGKLIFAPDASNFIYDSSHCDWAYIVNLDSDELEVWKGGQLDPDHEDNRWAEEKNRYGKEPGRMGYYPCAMVRRYDLNELPNLGLFFNVLFFLSG